MKKLLIYIMCTVILLSNIGVTVEASGNRYYAGEYKKKIKGTTYYISMNAYTSFDDDGVGCFYIFKGKKNLKNFKYRKLGEIKHIGKNKYRYKTKSGSLTFKINKKSMTVKQKGAVIKGVKLNGTFKKTKKYPKP